MPRAMTRGDSAVDSAVLAPKRLKTLGWLRGGPDAPGGSKGGTIFQTTPSQQEWEGVVWKIVSEVK